MTSTGRNIETRFLGPAITPDIAGERIDAYLSQRFPFFSRSGWQKEIDMGVVYINEKPARKSSLKLQIGDQLSRLHPLSEEPEVDTNIKILWTDGHIAAIEKPAGLPMHESGRYRRKTVAGIIPDLLGTSWGYVHRLDRETSGIVICASSPELRAKLVSHWTNLGVAKSYLAIITSVPNMDNWTVNLPILAIRHERTNRAQIHPEGLPAQTNFRVISKADHLALIVAEPKTGRTNQIRLHLEANGYRLHGEKVYGVDPAILELYRKEGNTELVQKMAGGSRHMLHAWKVGFQHPITGEQVVFECEMPSDMKAIALSNKLFGP
ncbi:MAG: RluA family pseudouridine synthase [Proteobacteria bacterium]|nr:RluA family pseudouridine synthase [Pseudomonadota bacterium]